MGAENNIEEKVLFDDHVDYDGPLLVNSSQNFEAIEVGLLHDNVSFVVSMDGSTVDSALIQEREGISNKFFAFDHSLPKGGEIIVQTVLMFDNRIFELKEGPQDIVDGYELGDNCKFRGWDRDRRLGFVLLRK